MNKNTNFTDNGRLLIEQKEYNHLLLDTYEEAQSEILSKIDELEGSITEFDITGIAPRRKSLDHLTRELGVYKQLLNELKTYYSGK